MLFFPRRALSRPAHIPVYTRRGSETRMSAAPEYHWSHRRAPQTETTSARGDDFIMETLRHLISNSIYPLAAFAVSLILTRLCIAVLPHLGYMDMPKGRHIHKKPVPRAGGIGFILAFTMPIVQQTVTASARYHGSV